MTGSRRGLLVTLAVILAGAATAWFARAGQSPEAPSPADESISTSRESSSEARLDALPVRVKFEPMNAALDASALRAVLRPGVSSQTVTAKSEDVWVQSRSGTRHQAVVNAQRRSAPPEAVVDPRSFGASISPAARRLSAIVPLWPEARIVLSAGHSTGAAQRHAVFVDGDEHAGARIEDGELRGVRAIPGTQVLVLEAGDHPHWRRVGHMVLGAAPEASTALDLRAINGSLTKEATAHMSTRRLDPYGRTIDVRAITTVSAWNFHRGPERTRPLRVSVVAYDGSPAVGAQVRIGHDTERTDAQGVARFAEVLVGEQALGVWGDGAPWFGSVDVADVAHPELRIEVLRSASVELEVVDDDERPMPGARLFVELRQLPFPWCDLDDHGVQRIDPYVGSDGRRRLHSLPPNTKIAIAARFGWRIGHFELTLRPGVVRRLRLVLSKRDR